MRLSLVLERLPSLRGLEAAAAAVVAVAAPALQAGWNQSTARRQEELGNAGADDQPATPQQRTPWVLLGAIAAGFLVALVLLSAGGAVVIMILRCHDRRGLGSHANGTPNPRASTSRSRKSSRSKIDARLPSRRQRLSHPAWTIRSLDQEALTPRRIDRRANSHESYYLQEGAPEQCVLRPATIDSSPETTTPEHARKDIARNPMPQTAPSPLQPQRAHGANLPPRDSRYSHPEPRSMEKRSPRRNTKRACSHESYYLRAEDEEQPSPGLQQYGRAVAATALSPGSIV